MGDKVVQFVGQLRAIQQADRQVDRHRDAEAAPAPDAIGGQAVFQHARQQLVVQPVLAQRAQERARQHQAQPAMPPAHQRLGADDGAGGQGFLGLEPGLDAAIAQGGFDAGPVQQAFGVAAMGLRLLGIVGRATPQAVRQAGDLLAGDGFDEGAEHREAVFLGHQPDAVGHAPRTSGDDGKDGPQVQARQFMDELHAVHAGHADVHEHQVVAFGADAVERGAGAFDGIHMPEAGLLQHVLEMQALQRVVVQDKHFVIGELFHFISFAMPCRVWARTMKGRGLHNTWVMPAATPRCAISAAELEVRPMRGPS
ncbi:Uncharacterised protein [Achromobacter xylosoxidans]|nr:Uncharacterised protein [Achromobacter xylosoxidans]CUJ02937.1 Uncharacterised protein [Achromobacter xylosoxidans]CUJ38270.1 Uncharacterised protein [Achromobacter xylosoxidans]CUJ67344.1 Uncharacterised protein [Achromobacter xylosoxidans]CUJ81052.1 Uncharacterised protein [Achromobacter xylosoxidans]